MMETKKSNVIGIEPKGEYNGNYGFEIEFDNGDKGYYKTEKETQTEFIQGSVCEYTIKEWEKNGKTYFFINKPKQARFGGGGNNQALQKERLEFDKGEKTLVIVRQSSLNRAIEVYNLPQMKDMKAKREEIIVLAEYFTNWVLNVK